MPRTINPEMRERVFALHKANPKLVGLSLGVAVFKSNIPIKAVAQLLTASEATVYRWVYGEAEPRAVYHANISKLITILNRALKAGDAPMTGTTAQRMAGVSDLIVAHKVKPVRPS